MKRENNVNRKINKKIRIQPDCSETNPKASQKNRGSTMVEVLVGFTLLALLMAGISGVVKVSVNLFLETKEMQQQQVEFQEKYFKKNPEGIERETVVAAGKLRLVQTDADGEAKSGGIEIKLPRTQVDRLTDSQSGLSVYWFLRQP